MSVFIVGAIETSPGVMTIDYIDEDEISTTYSPITKTILVQTDEYLSCWN